MFEDRNVVGTVDVARQFELSEVEARYWAEELAVAKIGNSYAWAEPDVEELRDRLEDETVDDTDSDEDDVDGPDGDDEDDDEDDDGLEDGE